MMAEPKINRKITATCFHSCLCGFGLPVIDLMTHLYSASAKKINP